MRVSVICTGTELLKGTTVNTNLSFIGQQLAEIGIVPVKALIIGDEISDLKGALVSAAEESELIITTGGLGPTHDDLTRNVVCDFLKLDLKRNADIESNLALRWKKRYPTEPPADYLSQADVPENSIVLNNAVGTAPGLWVKGKTEVILLPGPPNELNPMFENEAMPILRKTVKGEIHTSSFMVSSAAELLVQQEVAPLIKGLPLSLAYCSSVEGVKVFFSGTDKNLVGAKAMEAKKMFGKAVLANNELSLINEISMRLKEQGITFGTAESCTGGLIAAAMTDISGSSKIFSGSIVSYSNSVKNKLLGVSQEILDSHGAVSAECVEAMVYGAANALDVDAAVAVSGIAGPEGGTAEKPVGLVYIAAFLKGKVTVSENIFPGNRDSVRNRAKIKALLMLRELLIDSI
jgi:nicotinamide-nucleotide amidase